jgi:hypothetical protein
MSAAAEAVQYSFFWIIFAGAVSFRLFQRFGLLDAFLR